MATKARTAPLKTEMAAPAAIPTLEAATTAVQNAAPQPAKQGVAYTKEQTEKMGKQVFQAYEDLAGFYKGNVDAFVQSSNILVKGFESLSKTMVAYGQTRVEQSVAATKAMMTVKTVRELVDLQSEFARSSFDSLVAETTKVSELSVKVAGEAIEPLSARINATVEKFAKPVAA